MYTQVYHRREKTQASAMAPWKEAKENIEIARQGLDNVSDTSPQSVDSIPSWSFVSDILQSELVNYSDSKEGMAVFPCSDKFLFFIRFRAC
jgi:hypothetical protein